MHLLLENNSMLVKIWTCFCGDPLPNILTLLWVSHCLLSGTLMKVDMLRRTWYSSGEPDWPTNTSTNALPLLPISRA